MAETDAASRIRSTYFAAIDAHVKARIQHAEEFLRVKMMATPDNPITDKQAEARAILATNDAQNRTEQLLHMARLDMEQMINGQEPTQARTEPTH